MLDTDSALCSETFIYALKGDKEKKDKYFHLATIAGRPAEELERAIAHYKSSAEDDGEITE